MAKAIITINDDDAEAPDGFSVEVTFDPPLPKVKNIEKLKDLQPPKCAIVTAMILDIMKDIAAASEYEESSSYVEH